MRLRGGRLLAATAMLLTAAAAHPAQAAPAREEAPRVVVLSSTLDQSRVNGPSQETAEVVMDESVYNIFASAGYEVSRVPVASSKVLTNQQLARIGKPFKAQYVVYPRIMTL